MKITAKGRLALLAGLSLLTLLVFATGIQAAQAATVAGGGAGSGAVSFAPPHELQAPTAAAPAGTQGSVAVLHNATGGRTVPNVSNPAVSGTSGTSARTARIVAGSIAVAVVVIAAWVLVSRRQPSRRPSAAYCAQHPGDPLCKTT